MESPVDLPHNGIVKPERDAVCKSPMGRTREHLRDDFGCHCFPTSSVACAAGRAGSLPVHPFGFC